MFYEILTNKESTYINPLTINSPDKNVLDSINNRLIKNKLYKYEYSNINFTILGMIIKQIEQEKYQTIMKRYITDDLKLKNTNFNFEDVIAWYTKKVI